MIRSIFLVDFRFLLFLLGAFIAVEKQIVFLPQRDILVFLAYFVSLLKPCFVGVSLRSWVNALIASFRRVGGRWYKIKTRGCSCTIQT